MSISGLQIIDKALRTALYDRFGEWLDLPEVADGGMRAVLNYPPQTAQREYTEKIGANEKYSFINYWRTSTQLDMNRIRYPLGAKGLDIAWVWEESAGGDGETYITNYKAQPVINNYDITFWSLSKETINRITEEFIFWHVSHPKIDVVLDDRLPLSVVVKLGVISDDSIIDEKFNKNQIFKVRMGVTIESWAFKAYPNNTTSTAVGGGGNVGGAGIDTRVKKIMYTVWDGHTLTPTDYVELFPIDDNVDYDLNLVDIVELTDENVTLQ